MQKRSKILIILIALTLCFIWGNSLMLASTSSMISEKIKDAKRVFQEPPARLCERQRRAS
jgi:hypothetical protein